MKVSEIKEIISLFNDSNLSTLKIDQENFHLKLSKEVKQRGTPVSSASVEIQAPAQIVNTQQQEIPQVSQYATSSTKADFITSPMVGTFYRAPSPGAAPYVSVGDIIKKGQTIGIVEAMKIMNEIEAECDCKILEIEVNDAQPVEFGTKLVMIEKV